MPLDDSGTIAVLTPIGGATAPMLSNFSFRAAQHSLELIAGPAPERDINGTLIDLTSTQFRKYKVALTCKDFTVPALDNAWIGQQVTLDCALEMAYFTAGGVAQRPSVTGSARIEGAYTFYRMSLTMMITGIKTVFDEWATEYSSDIELEEV